MSYDGMWNYRDEAGFGDDPTYGEDIIGFGVEALDGSIGKVDQASYEVGSSYLVVDTGPWIFGQKVVIPAGTVQRVDFENETVLVNRTKEQIKNAPAYNEATYRDPDYQEDLRSYYGPEGRGYQNW
jgi:hypothetical protein